jgi:inner membrane protein
MAPVDNYRQTERTVKYATLFILLMFTAYFLFEVMAKLKIHPLQYILIGAAICVFYLGILALSEFCSFSWSYAASAFAAWAMVSLYTLSVLKSGRKTLIISAILAILQAFFYVMTQLQDYSMIFGAVMLFVALGSVMFVTRRLDWYDNTQESADASSQAPRKGISPTD